MFAPLLEMLIKKLAEYGVKKEIQVRREKAEVQLLAVCDDRELAEAVIEFTRKMGAGYWRGLPALTQIFRRGAASREDVLQIINEAPMLLRSPPLALTMSRREHIPLEIFKRNLTMYPTNSGKAPVTDAAKAKEISDKVFSSFKRRYVYQREVDETKSPE